MIAIETVIRERFEDTQEHQLIIINFGCLKKGMLSA